MTGVSQSCSGKKRKQWLMGRQVNMYISRPESVTNTTNGILFLTDVIGIQLVQSKLWVVASFFFPEA